MNILVFLVFLGSGIFLFSLNILDTGRRIQRQVRARRRARSKNSAYFQNEIWPCFQWYCVSGHNIASFAAVIILYLSIQLSIKWLNYIVFPIFLILFLRMDTFFISFEAIIVLTPRLISRAVEERIAKRERQLEQLEKQQNLNQIEIQNHNQNNQTSSSPSDNYNKNSSNNNNTNTNSDSNTKNDTNSQLEEKNNADKSVKGGGDSNDKNKNVKKKKKDTKKRGCDRIIVNIKNNWIRKNLMYIISFISFILTLIIYVLYLVKFLTQNNNNNYNSDTGNINKDDYLLLLLSIVIIVFISFVTDIILSYQWYRITFTHLGSSTTLRGGQVGFYKWLERYFFFKYYILVRLILLFIFLLAAIVRYLLLLLENNENDNDNSDFVNVWIEFVFFCFVVQIWCFSFYFIWYSNRRNCWNCKYCCRIPKKYGKLEFDLANERYLKRHPSKNVLH